MKLARVYISSPLLMRLLRLEDVDIHIKDAGMDKNFYCGPTVELLLTGAGLPEEFALMEGEKVPLATVVIDGDKPLATISRNS